MQDSVECHGLRSVVRYRRGFYGRFNGGLLAVFEQVTARALGTTCAPGERLRGRRRSFVDVVAIASLEALPLLMELVIDAVPTESRSPLLIPRGNARFEPGDHPLVSVPPEVARVGRELLA